MGCVIFILVGSDRGAKQKRDFDNVTFISGNKTSSFSVTSQGLGKKDGICPKLMAEDMKMCFLVRAVGHLREW
jgi:hypothetical protein